MLALDKTNKWVSGLDDHEAKPEPERKRMEPLGLSVGRQIGAMGVGWGILRTLAKQSAILWRYEKGGPWNASNSVPFT